MMTGLLILERLNDTDDLWTSSMGFHRVLLKTASYSSAADPCNVQIAAAVLCLFTCNILVEILLFEGAFTPKDEAKSDSEVLKETEIMPQVDCVARGSELPIVI